VVEVSYDMIWFICYTKSSEQNTKIRIYKHVSEDYPHVDVITRNINVDQSNKYI